MNGRYSLSRASATTVMLLLALTASPSHCSGKSKNNRNAPPHQTVYDQKQTGDYNIQLHLKDFQIIALLSGDEAGAGDYDYSYDYSDFTVKPVTQKPLGSTTGSTASVASTKPSLSSTQISNSHPYPIVSPTFGSTSPPSSSSSSTSTSMTTVGSVIIDENKKSTPKPTEDSFFNEVEKINSSLAEMLFGKLTTTTAAPQRIESTTKNEKLEQTMSPGKIKVQIIEGPSNLGIVPDEDSHEQSGAVPVAEGGAMLRRCASGFTKDKRGRCRRVRRPQTQLPFGFSRLASMAAKFRQPTADTLSSSESVGQ